MEPTLNPPPKYSGKKTIAAIQYINHSIAHFPQMPILPQYIKELFGTAPANRALKHLTSTGLLTPVVQAFGNPIYEKTIHNDVPS